MAVVRLLGPLEVECGGRTVAVSGAKERALVVALALHASRVVPVEELIAAVWGGDPPPSAAASLRVLVARLRKSLAAAGAPNALLTRPQGYLMDAEDVDAAEFERLSGRGRAELAGGRPAAAAATFRRALALWRGDRMAETTTEPLRAASAQLEQARLAAVEARLEADLACGHHAQLTGELATLCAAHPLREHLWALRITALYRCGRQADALATYRELRTTLDEELGIRPSAELRQLEAAVLVQDPGLAAPVQQPAADSPHATPLAPPLAALRQTALVGRSGPVAALRAAWHGTEDGRTHVALVSGPPGIGKSRLLAELADEVRERGAVVLYGRCDQEPAVPYQPVAEWLDQIRQEGEQWLVTADPRSVATLARLVPAIAEHLPQPALTSVVDPDSLRYEVATAVTGLLQRIAAGAPLLVICDDVHWIDQTTAQLLRHLLRHPPGQTLLVAAHRESEDPAGPLVELLGTLPPGLPLTRVPLTGLDFPDVLTLVTQALPRPAEPPQDLAVLLHQVTDGNPFYVTELLRHLGETRRLATGADDRWTVPADLLAAGVPTDLRAVLRARLARLEASTRNLLSVASVIGQQFDVDVLARTAGVDEDAALDGLEAAGRAAFVGEDPQVDGRFHFEHALVRLALYDDLGRSRRSRLHGRIAASLEEVDGAEHGERIGELARHALAGARRSTVPTAVRHGLAAARRALDTGAPEDAASWYAQVLAALDLAPDDATKAHCLIGLGSAQRMSGRAEFRDTLLAAADLARQLDREDLLVEAALEVDRGFFSTLGRIDSDKVRLLQDALGVPGEAPGRRARLCAALSAELAFDPDVDRRHGLAEEAVQLARASGDTTALLDALIRPDTALMVPSLSRERLDRLEEAVRLAEHASDPVRRFWAAHSLALARIEQADVAEIEPLLAMAQRDAAQVREPTMLSASRFVSAGIAVLHGDPQTAERLAHQALALGLDTGQPEAASVHIGQLFVIRWHQGRLAEPLPDLRSVADAMPDVPPAPATCALAEILAGSRTRAQDMLTDVAQRAFAYDGTMLLLPGLTVWAEVAAELEDAPAAALLHEHLQAWHALFATSGPIPFQSVALSLARLAALLGQDGAARSYFAEALATHEHMSAPFGIASTELHWGAFDLARDEDSGGRQRLARAAAIADEHGYAQLGHRARALLGRRDLAPPLVVGNEDGAHGGSGHAPPETRSARPSGL